MDAMKDGWMDGCMDREVDDAFLPSEADRKDQLRAPAVPSLSPSCSSGIAEPIRTPDLQSAILGEVLGGWG